MASLYQLAWYSLVALAAGEIDRQEIHVPGWPSSSSIPLSPGIISQNFVFASGMSGLNLTTMKPVLGGIQAETKQALTLIQQIVQAGGLAGGTSVEIKCSAVAAGAHRQAVVVPGWP